MKTVFVLFDSLNRGALEPYGGSWIRTPNFKRLGERCVTYDNCYAGSLPCMPARRDFHIGRLSFLHRSWGPMEPFDVSVIEKLQENGVYTHLISDHIHYFEEGGGNYHTKYNTWEIVRGQEGDKWEPCMEEPDVTGLLGRKDEARVQDIKNRKALKERDRYPIEKVFGQAEEFLRKNGEKDNWFLQVESFDPHEPFFAREEFRRLYPHAYEGMEFDWPDYKKVTESREEVAHCRYEYAALVSACDYHLGRLLDIMDAQDMWKDTMLIVTTDHGYLLGEHGWWAKTVQPVYEEIGHTPLFIHHPKREACGGRNGELVQMCDLAPTVLDAHGLHIPEIMTGKSLLDEGRKKEGCLFGIHGCHLNITDGRYVYMRRPRTDVLYNYTLMPCHMKDSFAPEELRAADLCEGNLMTNGMKVLRVPAKPWAGVDFGEYGDMLFDTAADPMQERPIRNEAVEKRLLRLAADIMKENDAPEECYAYWGMVFATKINEKK